MINEKKVKLRLWQSFGSERFRSTPPSYYRGVNGILLFYDITDRNSFENLNYWLTEIEKNSNKNVKILLVGNKTDLENERKVTYEEGQEFAKAHNLLFIEISIKTNYNIQESIELLTKEIFEEFVSLRKKNNNNKEKTIHLLQRNVHNSSKKMFC